ncbi:MAG TPA: hypothetical protein DD791_12445 [Syntrophomonas sp.]|nr:hypothetical protein [Syntrophomonas sp.]
MFPLPDGVRLGFLIAIILMLGFLLRTIIYENEEKIKAFLGTFPASSYKKGELMPPYLVVRSLLKLCSNVEM